MGQLWSDDVNNDLMIAIFISSQMVKVKAAFIYHERQLFLSRLFIKIQQAVYYFDLAEPRPYVYGCRHEEGPHMMYGLFKSERFCFRLIF